VGSRLALRCILWVFFEKFWRVGRGQWAWFVWENFERNLEAIWEEWGLGLGVSMKMYSITGLRKLIFRIVKSSQDFFSEDFVARPLVIRDNQSSLGF
jgi:hypothetical protein